MNHLLERLSVASEKRRNQGAEFTWPAAVDETMWWMPPGLSSLHGTEVFHSLDEDARKLLSRKELSNFFSLNIHGERRLIAGVAARLARIEHPLVVRYLVHFIEEEARHLSYFSEYCRRYGEVFAERIAPIGTPETEREPDADTLVFFARIVIFETLVDDYNRRIASDRCVEPLAREINRMHHVDESRHLAFGRALVGELGGAYLRNHGKGAVDDVREHLNRYLASIWRDLANAQVYQRAGLEDPYRTHQQALAALRSRDVEVREALGVLTELNLLSEVNHETRG